LSKWLVGFKLQYAAFSDLVYSIVQEMPCCLTAQSFAPFFPQMTQTFRFDTCSVLLITISTKKFPIVIAFVLIIENFKAQAAKFLLLTGYFMVQLTPKQRWAY
jgi:hypothetical protein